MQANEHIKKGPIAWMAGNSVASSLLMLLFLVGGVLFAFQIKQEVFPEFTLDTVVVSVPYPGASPEEVEQGIVLAIEDAVQGLDGVEEVTSTASEGIGTVTIEAVDGTDVGTLTRDVKSEVDRITTFPEEAEDPQIAEASTSRQVLVLALYGDHSERVLREKTEELRDALLQNENITLIKLRGARDHEVHVEISQEQLRRYGLTLADVATAIDAASVEVPGGTMRTEAGDVLVRIKERRDWAWEFGAIPLISKADGSQVLVRDVAEVREDFEEGNVYAVFDDQPAVMLEVYRIGTQTPVDVSDAVKDVLEKFNADLPPGMRVAIRNDMSDIFRQRAELLLKNAWMGLGLVFILLALFLEIRVAFWVSLGIPISFLGSFLFLPMVDLSINMVSMFAFIIALGIVVDDAIVVGEHIHARRQQGMGALRAAVEGAREMALPVTFAILTNVAAFSPLLFVPGFMGKVFINIPIVVITVFLISLVESLYVLPAHMAHTKGFGNGKGRFGRLHDAFQRRFNAMVAFRYSPLLTSALRWRYAVLAGGVAMLVITAAYVGSARMGFSMFPKVESDRAYAEATLPYGSPHSSLEEVRQLLTQAAIAVGEENGGEQLYTSTFAVVNDNVISFNVYLTDADTRPISTMRFVSLWRDRVGDIPGLENLVFQSDRGGPGAGAAITVELSHRDIETLNEAGRRLAAELAEFSGVTEIDDGSAKGKQQLDFHMLPAGLAAGLTARSVASQVRAAYQGSQALSQQRGRNEMTVRVQLPRTDRATEHSLETLILRTPDGGEIPLAEAASIERGRAYTEIKRRKGRRAITVTCDARPASQSTRIQNALKAEVMPRLVAEIPGLAWSFQGHNADMQESMQALVEGMALALILIYALLAIPFNSYAQPMIIMTCIPFGVVGAVIGHLIMGYSLSVLSMFGVVALAGVVVNDSLVLIDAVNIRRRRGAGLYKAVIESGRSRFRPILLTTLTTFFGLAPMILETSRQARFMIPMAISLGFGILFATGITLILVPCLYCILEDIKALFRRLSGTKQERDGLPELDSGHG